MCRLLGTLLVTLLGPAVAATLTTSATSATGGRLDSLGGRRAA